MLSAARREGFATKIVFLSAYDDSGSISAAIAKGAAGYLSKEADRKAILDAVSAASRGQVVLSPELQTGLASEIQRRETRERPVLTTREREVLSLIADGGSAPRIAQQLHLSPATIKTHLQTLYEKLGVSDRAAAVAAAMRSGLLE